MSKFNNIEGNMELISRVAQQSAEINKAVPKIKTLALADLQSHPKNSEDITDTQDLELSISKNGFTDPIEVVLLTREMAAALNLKQGYVIVSGHRRKAAALKLNLKKVPCMVYEHDNELDIENHLLMANAHRDSSKDPLLMYRRVIAHKDFLLRAGYEGDLASVIGKRLGISEKSVYRRMALDNLTQPLLEMIKSGDIAETTAELLCTLPETVQAEVGEIFTTEKADGTELTRAFVKSVIDRCIGKEVEAQPQLEIESKPEPETDYSDDRGDEQSDNLSEEPEATPEPEPETEQESEPVQMSEPETESQPESAPEVEPEQNAGPEQESNPVIPAASNTPVSVATTASDTGEDASKNYPIDPAIVNSIIENEFEVAGKRKMKQVLTYLGELEDVAGLGAIEWAELKNEDEAIDTITLIRNVVVGLMEEVSVIGETFELEGKDPEVDNFIEQINLLTARNNESMIA